MDLFISKDDQWNFWKMPKVPRSKHWRLCDVCVPRFDHHWIWVNNDIGEGNYKYFYIFLVIHMIYWTYGFLIGFATLCSVVEEKHLFNAVFQNISTGEKIEASWSIVLRYMFDTYLELSFTIIIQFVCSVMLIVFTSYHSYLIFYNSTTAESVKLSEHLSYFKKKKSLLDWVKEDKEEVKRMFNEKELGSYSIDIKKIDDNDYICDGIKVWEENIQKIKAFPYHKQKIIKTLYDIFFR